MMTNLIIAYAIVNYTEAVSHNAEAVWCSLVPSPTPSFSSLALLPHCKRRKAGRGTGNEVSLVPDADFEKCTRNDGMGFGNGITTQFESDQKMLPLPCAI